MSLNVSKFFENSQVFNSPTAKFLLDSENPEALKLLSRLESIRLRYPQERRAHLDNQLRDFSRFRGAIWELFIFGKLLDAGFEVKIEENINSNLKQVDFTWVSSGKVCRIEATSKSLTQEMVKIDLIQSELYDQLAKKILNRNRFIHISVIEFSKQIPNVDLVCEAVEKLCGDGSGLDAPLTSILKEVGSGWEFEISVSEKQSIESKVAMLSLGPKETDSLVAMDYRQFVDLKIPKFEGSNFGENTIALVGAHRFPPSLFGAIEIIFGSPAVTLDRATGGTENTLVNPALFYPGNKEYRHISAFMLGYGSLPGFTSTAPILVCLNPNAVFPVDLDSLPFEAQYLRIGQRGFELSEDLKSWSSVSPWDDRFKPSHTLPLFY